MGAGAQKQVRNRKVLVAGEKGVGKTTLLHTLTTGVPPQDHSEPLVSDLYTKTVDTKTITFQLQFAEMEEVLPSALQDYLGDCELALLLFSTSSPSSIMKLKPIYEHLRNQKTMTFLLVKTKTDIDVPLEETTEDALDTIAHIMNFARIIDTSALTSTSGMDNINAILTRVQIRKAPG
eukprot:TRINITY_DN4892_c0_g1_i1.p1 TRINITY_DN4892_c0_g1~~TRINITY_DN4892_c0_g1_i1.p1  ORF type:complete len:178 (+),score=37.71 TRINITY_DN4892_c0_g1_i1:32-565(+)